MYISIVYLTKRLSFDLLHYSTDYLFRKALYLDARFRNPPIGGFKHVECLCGMPWIVSLEKTWFFQLCMMASTMLVKQHGYIQWTNCTKNTLLGN